MIKQKKRAGIKLAVLMILQQTAFVLSDALAFLLLQKHINQKEKISVKAWRAFLNIFRNVHRYMQQEKTKSLQSD